MRIVLSWALRIALGLGGIGLAFAGSACHRNSGSSELGYFDASAVALSIPKQPGWLRDTSINAGPDDAGGIVLRLVRDSAVAGSPRVDVVVEAKRERPTVLDEFLTRNLREMAQLESTGNLRITHVDQKTVNVGSVPGWRVHHEYSVGTGPAQVAINQISTFLVLDGRGVAVTAAGRAELFAPLAESISTMLDGLTTTAKPEKQPAPAVVAPLKGVPDGLEPVDLGKVGGATTGGK